MRKSIIVSLIVALTLMALLVKAVSLFQLPGDKTIRLPQGYYIGNIDSNPILLLRPGSSRQRMGPSLDGYLVFPRIITGHMTDTGHIEGKAGYFIVDMVTGKIYEGLSEEAWRTKLREYETTGDLKLWKPSRRDERLGRNRARIPWGK